MQNKLINKSKKSLSPPTPTPLSLPLFLKSLHDSILPIFAKPILLNIYFHLGTLAQCMVVFCFLMHAIHMSSSLALRPQQFDPFLSSWSSYSAIQLAHSLLSTMSSFYQPEADITLHNQHGALLEPLILVIVTPPLKDFQWVTLRCLTKS